MVQHHNAADRGSLKSPLKGCSLTRRDSRASLSFPYWTGPDFQLSLARPGSGFPIRKPSIGSETYFQYSNLGITLAGEIVAAASGQPYDAYVRSHIRLILVAQALRPRCPDAEHGGSLAQWATPCCVTGGGCLSVFRKRAALHLPRGFVFTAEDLARFVSWQFRVLGRKGGRMCQVEHVARNAARDRPGF